MFEHPIHMTRSSKYGNNYWTGYSYKMGRMVELFSDLEYDHWLTVECNPKIIKFCEQPLIIEESIDRKQFHSIPDMWVLNNKNEESIIEIKYLSALTKEHPKYLQTMRQIEIQKRWAKKNNLEHFVISEDAVRMNRTLLNNYRKIIAYVRQYNSNFMPINEKILNQIKKGRCSFHKIIDGQKEHDYISTISLMYLIYSGNIYSDIDIQPISKNTEVWVYET